MRFQCVECQGIVDVDDARMGKKVQCGHCEAEVKVPETRLSPGAIIADFIIVREIGRGGMGVVYETHQISLDRPAALKVLEAEYTEDAEFVSNFIREARSAAKLNHPHIVQAYAVGEDNGIFYFAMEYIDGLTMKDIVKRDKIISPADAANVIQQIAEALDYAWKEQKLVHRDIKPDNIMITKKNRAKLADLGLSQVAGEVMDGEDDDEIMGTPQYISPEHLTGQPMDVRSDIYSLGATFYQMVTGKFPYLGRTPNDTARMHLESELVPPKEINSKIPDDMNTIIVKMMEKRAVDRYQDAHELVNDLNSLRRFMKGHSLKLNTQTKTKLSLNKDKKQKNAALAKGVKPATVNTTSSVLESGKDVKPPENISLIDKQATATKAPALKAPAGKTIQAPAGGSQLGGLTPPKTIAPKTTPPSLSGKGTETVPAGTTPPKPDNEAPKSLLSSKNEEEKKKEETPGFVPIKRDFKPARKGMGKLVKLAIFLVILAGAGAGVWYFVLDQKMPSIPYIYEAPKPGTETTEGPVTPPPTKPEKPVKPVPVKPPPKPKPQDSEYYVSLKNILKDYQDFKNDKSFMFKADNFLVQHPQPANQIEESLLSEMMEKYVLLDEARIGSTRDSLRAEHKRQIEARGVSKVDPEAVRKRIEAEIERQRRAAEQARLAKLRQAEIAKRTAEYKKKLNLDSVQLQIDFLDYLLNFKYDKIKPMLENAIAEPGRVKNLSPGERKLAANFVSRPKEYLKQFDDCMKLYEALYNSGTKLAGRQMELPPRRLLQIVNIKDRYIELKNMTTGKTVKIAISNLKGRFYRGYAKKALKDFKVPNEKFCLMIIDGRLGPEIIPVTPRGFWQKELPRMKYQYLRAEYRKADKAGREAMQKRFGQWKQFSSAIKGIQ